MIKEKSVIISLVLYVRKVKLKLFLDHLNTYVTKEDRLILDSFCSR
jgi:hypothetical protein